MAAPRRVVELEIRADELARLETVARSRTEAASRVSRARIMLAYRAEPSSTAVGARLGVTHHTVQRCLRRAARLGVVAAPDDSPRPGKAPDITPEARAWLVSLACQKACDLGYPHELWTTRLLARHAREHAVAAGHPSLARIVQGTVCKILAGHAIKPHKVRYYLERRDHDFDAKMAEVLCVYREVAVFKESDTPVTGVAIISYDEKPGIQAIGNTAPGVRARSRIQAPRHAQFAGWHRPAHRSRACPHRRSPSLARVRRFSQATRCRLSSADRHQTDPRQSLGPHLERNRRLARNPAGGTFLLRVHPETRLLAQPR